MTGRPFNVTARPTTAGSRPNRRAHSPSPIIATGGAPGRSSSGVNARPATGARPSSGMSEGLTRLPDSCSGSPRPLSVKLEKPIALSASTLRARSRHESKLSTDAPKFGRPSASFFSATWISRPGSANGSGRSSTALTTLKKIAVLAAIASATVPTTAAVNIGARRIRRTA